MKKLLCLLLALLMVLSLAACGESDTRRDDDDDEDEVREDEDRDRDEDEDEDTDTDRDEDREASDDTPEEPSEPETEPRKESFVDALAARYAADTENGYSMWYTSQGFSTTKRLCVDSRGYSTFEIEAEEKPITNVYHDAVATRNGEITRLRSAKNGSILFDSQDHGDSHIVIPEHRGDLMYQDGYLLVVQKSESYSGVSYALGFLNPQGKWIHELSTENPILGYITEEASMEYFEEDLLYCGEGMLAFEDDNDVYHYFNIRTGRIVDIQPGNGLSDENAFDEIECGILFRDGCSDPTYIKAYNESSGFYLFYTDGRVEKMPMEYYDDFKRSEIIGDVYYDRDTQTACFLFADSTGLYVVDNQANLIQWHKNVDVADVDGFKEDGTAQLILENSEGSFYYTVIGTDGQFLFEPVALDSGINGVFDANGNEVEPKSHYGTGKFVVISNSGEILYTSDYVNDFAVNNGVVYFEDDIDYYIDISK